MIEMHDLARYRVELADLIEKWLQKYEGGLPLLGEGTALYMADAALAVLLAMDNVQEQLRRDDMLKDDE